MRFFVSLILLFSLACFCYGQEDSTYIKKHDEQIAIKVFTSKNYIYLNQELGEEVKFNYRPNNPPILGLGLSINNTIIDLSYGYGFKFMRNGEHGKTYAVDFQLHNYGQKFVIDLFIQKYKGFYLADEDNNNSLIALCPDLQVRQYGLYGHYVFNNKRFSYGAAFVQNKRQKISAGSFLLGGGVYLTKIQSDGSFVHKGKTTIRNMQFGISAGYAYTWVLGSKWFINGSSTVGINFGNEDAKTIGKGKIEVYPTFFPRISAGYNRSSWSLGMSYIGNIVFPSFSDKYNVSLNSGTAQITFTQRLNLSFLSKKDGTTKIPSLLVRP